MTHRTVTAVADDYVAALAALDPSAAEALGQESDLVIPDLSPGVFDDQLALARRTLADLGSATETDPDERVLRIAMTERLTNNIALAESGFTTRLLAPLATPVHGVKQIFDNLPASDADETARLLRNLEQVPTALQQYRQTLTAAADQGFVAPARQARLVAEQARGWGDPDVGYFRTLADDAAGVAADAEAMSRAGAAAAAACVDLAHWLETEHAPRGSAQDGVGREFYQVTSRAFLGAEIDLEETYQYGWDRLTALTAEVDQLTQEISDEGPTAAMETLDDRPGQRLPVGPELVTWIEDRITSSIETLDGTVFDLPPEVRNCEGRLATPGSGVIYYSPPDVGLTRPGRVYWSTPPDADDAPVWREVSTVHHEGVPGHHLQYSVTMTQDHLHPWQRYLCHIHGYAEGWAHYTEGRAESWGLVHDEGERLSVLLAQRWRAARIVVDLGLHLDLPIPADNGVTSASQWSREVGQDVLVTVAGMDRHTAVFEVDRYLGWPGQALAFCVGARLWEQARDAARQTMGSDYDEKAFHMTALGLGPMGLDPLRSLLTERTVR
ncbi:DUF885 domain-containing protein [Ornithinimicrobium faecis]|uniref:DUF885 domain-containing protein n=1 Tax=Ornithinimicrobium faecis TaxID=2934158 RepID=A0ABY4YQW2_9MICO|nr:MULTISPECIES: DUF885 domain-containing protein [unclassified Ornithinimicrobium]USQ78665.1 DUF885 domain-containing protein [Ornithinimicrobium sp. HY1793]